MPPLSFKHLLFPHYETTSLLVRLREAWLLITLCLLLGLPPSRVSWVLHAPFIAVGLVLSGIWLSRKFAEIRWRNAWVVAVPYLLFFIALAGKRDDGGEYYNMAVQYRLVLLYIPPLFVGLRPSRRWLDLWVAATSALFAIGLARGIHDSFMLDYKGALLFWPYIFPDQTHFGFINNMLLGNMQFTYAQLGSRVLFVGYLAFMMAVSFVWSASNVLRASGRRRWIFIVATVWMLFGLVLAVNRGAQVLVGLAGGLVCLRILTHKGYRPIKKWMAVSIVSLTALLIITSPRVQYIFTHKTDNGRFPLWGYALERIDLPNGIGTGETFVTQVNESFPDGADYHDLHNMFLMHLYENGIVGFICFAFFMAIPFVLHRRIPFLLMIIWSCTTVFAFYSSIHDKSLLLLVTLWSIVVYHAFVQKEQGGKEPLDPITL